MIEHKFTAVKDKFGRGWLGQFTYAKDAVSCTAYVRDELGTPILFADASAATWAASNAMCRALNAAHRQARGKSMHVRHQGGKAHLKEIAERVFKPLADTPAPESIDRNGAAA
ncbi:hypothetical protein AB4037_23210 [Labrys sp. KB_33_2]|uniref:hypothetical protein n=1 Tax=Labrys sp. KB_33_2 TaxID=3237479 RepID=UPI003F90C01C